MDSFSGEYLPDMAVIIDLEVHCFSRTKLKTGQDYVCDPNVSVDDTPAAASGACFLVSG